MSKIILTMRAWRQLYKRIKKQGYVWIKLKDNCIITDKVYKYFRRKTVFFNVALKRQDYGKTFALTKEELEEI